MLQQTQVRTVLPRYHAWLRCFPDIASLAAAGEQQVLKAWEGLGYYRRARYLHQAARRIMDHHQGVFPHRFDDILALPGIGRSTAGAIASFAFGLSYPVLDGNVRRVLTRLHGREATAGEQWQQATALLQQSGQPALWNQAMMELGATICKRSPACADCPWQSICRARRQGMETMRPAAKSVRVQSLHWRVHIYRQGNKLWLQQRPATGIWASLWTPPVEAFTPEKNVRPDLIHQLTHRHLHLYTQWRDDQPDGEGAWFAPDEAPAMPTGIRRLLNRCVNF